jgi:hypothetical protein
MYHVERIKRRRGHLWGSAGLPILDAGAVPGTRRRMRIWPPLGLLAITHQGGGTCPPPCVSQVKKRPAECGPYTTRC